MGPNQGLAVLLERVGILNGESMQAMIKGSLASAHPHRLLRFRALPWPGSGIPPAAAPRLPVRALAPVLAVLLTALSCLWQEEVVLSGFVQDPSGSRIPHASVLIADSERAAFEATTAGADGAFRIRGLAPSSSYEIDVRGPPGFAPHVQRLDLTDDHHVEVTLRIEPIVEAIVVSGPPPQEEPGPSSRPRTRIRVGGNVRRARLVHHVPPAYPPDAERERVGGTVLLEGVIGTHGRLAGLSTLNSIIDERLVAAAMDAVLQWRYDPTQLNGRPVETDVTISVAFELP